MKIKTGKVIAVGMAVGIFSHIGHAETSAASIATAPAATESASATLAVPLPPEAVDGSSLTSKKTELMLKTILESRSLEDRYQNSKWSGAEVNVSGKTKIDYDLSARLDVSAIMLTGSYTNQYTTDGAPPNMLLINEGVVQYDPFTSTSLEAGVIQMDFLSLPSTFDQLGFPSARASYRLGNDFVKGSLFAMKSEPTSTTRTVQPTENGLMTTLDTYGASISSNPKDKDKLTLSAGATRFQFQNLNSSAASDSMYLGNNVINPGPQAKFEYGFAGVEYGALVKYKFAPSFEAQVNGAYLKNEQAPDGRNLGYLYSIGGTVPLKRYDLGATIGRYYNESDTLPGSYTSVERGSNNRFGNYGVLSFANTAKKVVGKFQYTRADQIETKPMTADREIFFVSLEIAYDVL